MKNIQKKLKLSFVICATIMSSLSMAITLDDIENKQSDLLSINSITSNNDKTVIEFYSEKEWSDESLPEIQNEDQLLEIHEMLLEDAVSLLCSNNDIDKLLKNKKIELTIYNHLDEPYLVSQFDSCHEFKENVDLSQEK